MTADHRPTALSPTGGVTGALLVPLLSRPAQPRLTVYGADGSRVELSTATLANWAAKVAGLLATELGAGPGSRVLLHTGGRWQTAPILLGIWWAGLVVLLDGAEEAAPDFDAVAAFVSQGEDADADEVFAVSADPLGAPCRDLPVHQRDFTTSVLPQSDRFTAPRLAADEPALLTGETTSSAGDLIAAARSTRLVEGTRLLSAAPLSTVEAVTRTLLAALAVDGSLVLVPPGPEEQALARLRASERVTAGWPAEHSGR